MGALGDAYGFCFEFAEPEHVAAHNDLRFHPPPDRDFAPGSYSDDTQMQLALAELIVSGKEWSRESIADAFVSTFKRDPRPGYARRFAAFLSSRRALGGLRAHRVRSGIPLPRRESGRERAGAGLTLRIGERV